MSKTPTETWLEGWNSGVSLFTLKGWNPGNTELLRICPEDKKMVESSTDRQVRLSDVKRLLPRVLRIMRQVREGNGPDPIVCDDYCTSFDQTQKLMGRQKARVFPTVHRDWDWGFRIVHRNGNLMVGCNEFAYEHIVEFAASIGVKEEELKAVSKETTHD